MQTKRHDTAQTFDKFHISIIFYSKISLGE